MKNSKRLLITVLAALTLALPTTFLLAQDEGSSSGGAQANAEGAGGKCRPHEGPHLLPPNAEQLLKLSDDQKQQLKKLEEEVRTKIKGILTPEQLSQLKQMHPHHPEGKGAGGGKGQGGEDNDKQSAQ